MRAGATVHVRPGTDSWFGAGNSRWQMGAARLLGGKSLQTLADCVSVSGPGLKRNALDRGLAAKIGPFGIDPDQRPGRSVRMPGQLPETMKGVELREQRLLGRGETLRNRDRQVIPGQPANHAESGHEVGRLDLNAVHFEVGKSPVTACVVVAPEEPLAHVVTLLVNRRAQDAYPISGQGIRITIGLVKKKCDLVVSGNVLGVYRKIREQQKRFAFLRGPNQNQRHERPLSVLRQTGREGGFGAGANQLPRQVGVRVGFLLGVGQHGSATESGCNQAKIEMLRHSWPFRKVLNSLSARGPVAYTDPGSSIDMRE